MSQTKYDMILQKFKNNDLKTSEKKNFSVNGNNKNIIVINSDFTQEKKNELKTVIKEAVFETSIPTDINNLKKDIEVIKNLLLPEKIKNNNKSNQFEVKEKDDNLLKFMRKKNNKNK